MCGLQESDGTVVINPARIKFAPLLERKPAKISCERKTMKWATKLAIKRKAKGKRREQVKNRNKFGKKKVQILAYAQKNGKAGNYIQAENYVVSLGNFFLVIPILTGRRKVQKGEFGPKCRLFAGELAGDKELSCQVILYTV